MSIEAVALHICSKRAALIIWWWPVWPFQPDLNNEVFDDTDGREGAGEGLTGKVSPRQPLLSDRREYMSFAAVPRRSTPSMDLQVPTASNTARASLCSCAWLDRWWGLCSYRLETTMLLLSGIGSVSYLMWCSLMVLGNILWLFFFSSSLVWDAFLASLTTSFDLLANVSAALISRN